MKKFGKVAVLAAALFGFVAVGNASAIGVAPSIGGGAARFIVNATFFGFGTKASTWGGHFDFRLALPHNYGSKGWYGQGEIGFSTPLFFELGYNVGYHFELGEKKLLLSPFAGLNIGTFISIGVNVGAELRIPAGRLGDVSIDLRFNPLWGRIGRCPAFTLNVGYVFLLGKDKRSK